MLSVSSIKLVANIRNNVTKIKINGKFVEVKEGDEVEVPVTPTPEPKPEPKKEEVKKEVKETKHWLRMLKPCYPEHDEQIMTFWQEEFSTALVVFLLAK